MAALMDAQTPSPRIAAPCSSDTERGADFDEEDFPVGDVLLEHSDNAAPRALGRILLKDKELDCLLFIEFPRLIDLSKASGPKRNYLRSPRTKGLSELIERKNKGEISTTKYTCDGAALLSEEQLDGEAPLPKGFVASRAKLQKWKAHRDCRYALIEPIVTVYSMSDLLVHGMCGRAVAERAEALGLKSTVSIYAALHAYWLGGSVLSALLPRWAACGAPGKRKFSKGGTGRPTKHHRKEHQGDSKPSTGNFNCTAPVREKLRRGWRKYKTGKRSVESAYLDTMMEYWPKSISYLPNGDKKVELLPTNQRPTKAQFEKHGPGGDESQSASRINAGRMYDRSQRGMRGTTKDGIRAIGTLVIDATSCDQTPVSMASRLTKLRSMWDTRTVCPKFGYIFGSYVSFERCSTMTALLSVRNTVLAKGPQCARYGHQLKSERDWYSINPKKVLADNGELKSEQGIKTLTDSEIILEFTRSYAAEHKVVESDHRRRHALTNHQQPGSTMGRLRGRGDRDPEDDACKNFAEFMHDHISGILFTNNEEVVPELLTIEMRGDGLHADDMTRRKALEWHLQNGYFQSQPSNLEELLVRTLPRIQGKMFADGVHLFDPRDQSPTRYIPGLIFRSDWLEDSGWLAKARKEAFFVAVHISPECLERIWIVLDGKLRELPLRSNDPLLSSLTLFDWLTITDDDQLRFFLARGNVENAKASHQASMDAGSKKAAQAKADEKQHSPSTPKESGKDQKNENTSLEIHAQKLEQLGLPSGKPKATAAAPTKSEDWLDDDLDYELVDFMDEVREGN